MSFIILSINKNNMYRHACNLKEPFSWIIELSFDYFHCFVKKIRFRKKFRRVYRESQKKNLAYSISMYWTVQKYFWKYSYVYKLIAHILTFLLAHFEVKLVNYSSHSELLNFQKNSKSIPIPFKNRDFTVFKNLSKTYWAFKSGLIWT